MRKQGPQRGPKVPPEPRKIEGWGGRGSTGGVRQGFEESLSVHPGHEVSGEGSRVAGRAEEQGRRGEGVEENPPLPEAMCVAGTDSAPMWISSDLCKGITVPNGDSACLF